MQKPLLTNKMMLFYKWKILSIIELEVEYYGIYLEILYRRPS